MHVTFEPEDGDRQEWDFSPGRIRASEAVLIEKRFGGNWDEFQAGVQSGNMAARRVMLWHLLRQQHAMLRFEDVPDFFADELVVQFSSKELMGLRESLAKAHLPEDKRELMLTGLDLELTSAMEREGALAEGKAPSPTSPTNGG
jgi:hypothetical protein